MVLRIPNYTGKDLLVLLWTLMPFTILLNTLIFGKQYYTDASITLFATLITFGVLALSFCLYGYIALAFRARFPDEKDIWKKMALQIPTFLLLTGLIIYSLFKGYELVGFYGYTFNETGFTWAYVCTGVLNIFLTFFNEALFRFQNWKQTVTETEQLKKEYMRSQLLGLKSQVNPHFLFNSLNSLSCLINDDPDKADKFLNEMSKVYRYLLRNNDEQFVTLRTELQFLNSYYHLLTERYGDGLQLKVEADDQHMEQLLPPLTLQMLLENAFNNNQLSKDNPLIVQIDSINGNWLQVSHNIQSRVGIEAGSIDAALDNISNKYRLLHPEPVKIFSEKNMRIVQFPLIDQNTEVKEHVD